MKCEHLISDENDECYPCKVKALFRIISEREEELKLVSEQRDLIAEKADKVEAHNAQLVEALNRSSELLTGIKAIEGLQLGGEQFPNLSDCHEQIEENGEALANQDQSWLEGKIAEAKAEGAKEEADKIESEKVEAVNEAMSNVLHTFQKNLLKKFEIDSSPRIESGLSDSQMTVVRICRIMRKESERLTQHPPTPKGTGEEA